jgi:hypothetical protein
MMPSAVLCSPSQERQGQVVKPVVQALWCTAFAQNPTRFQDFTSLCVS